MSPHISAWWRTDQAESASVAVLLAISAALLTLLICIPIILLIIAFGSIVLYAKGLDASPLPAFREPALWIPFFATSALAGLIVLFPALRGSIVAFQFDAEARQLTYTKHRPFWRPTVKSVPFDHIEQVIPTLLTSYATEGHFEVHIRGSQGSSKSCWMGNDIPIDKLNEHAQWLSLYLGDRVRPLLRLDC